MHIEYIFFVVCAVMEELYSMVSGPDHTAMKARVHKLRSFSCHSCQASFAFQQVIRTKSLKSDHICIILSQ